MNISNHKIDLREVYEYKCYFMTIGTWTWTASKVSPIIDCCAFCNSCWLYLHNNFFHKLYKKIKQNELR